MKDRIKELFGELFSLEDDPASHEEIRKTILSGSRIRGTNMCILILAIIIASVGLNMNSPAVIIGAMLISPLMGGIQAIGYGLATYDLRLARNAFERLLIQVVICIITSTLYFSLSPIETAYSELLARTKPTLWDVLIAIAGGLAGIIGITRKEKSNVIPGVAIATALMPPLCTAGFGLATGHMAYFAGALYLFFINSFFICLSTVIVIRIMKLPCKTFVDARAKRRMSLNLAVIAVITVVPSVYLAYQIAGDAYFNGNVDRYLSTEFHFQQTQMVQHSANREKGYIEVALIGKRIGDEEIRNLEGKLARYNLGELTLQVNQTEVPSGVMASDIEDILEKELKEKDVMQSSRQQAQENEDLKSEVVALKAQLIEYQNLDYDVSAILEEMHALHPAVVGCSLGIHKTQRLAEDETGQALVAEIDVDSPLPEEVKERIAQWLKVKTGLPTVEVYPTVTEKGSRTASGRDDTAPGTDQGSPGTKDTAPEADRTLPGRDDTAPEADQGSPGAKDAASEADRTEAGTGRDFSSNFRS